MSSTSPDAGSSSTSGLAAIPTATTTMTAIWTPPASCSSHWTYEAQNANSVVGGLLIQNAQVQLGDYACQPPGFTGWGRAPSTIQIFSPGVCPSGYTTANQAFQAATTTAVCCPSDFAFASQLSSVNAGDKTADYYGCTSTFAADAGYTTVFQETGVTGGFSSTLDGTTSVFTSVTGPITMWAQPITVAFQQDDLSIFGLVSTSALASAAASTTSSSSSSKATTAITSSPAATNTSTSNSSSLSGGATAGIVIGAAAIIGLIIGAALLFRRRQKKATELHRLETTNFNGGYATDKSPVLFGAYAGYTKAPYDAPPVDPYADNTYPQGPAELHHEPSSHVAELSSHDEERYELS